MTAPPYLLCINIFYLFLPKSRPQIHHFEQFTKSLRSYRLSPSVLLLLFRFSLPSSNCRGRIGVPSVFVSESVGLARLDDCFHTARSSAFAPAVGGGERRARRARSLCDAAAAAGSRFAGGNAPSTASAQRRRRRGRDVGGVDCRS